MRYLVLSDIHANIDALDTVLGAVPSTAYDEVIVLGDLVGYCAEPNQVVDRVRQLSPIAIIRGNHDKVAGGHETAERFNPAAQQAAEWTKAALTADNRAYLAGLDQGPVAVDDLVEICHGSPADEDAYIFSELDAVEALAALRHPVGLFGHTHLPMAVTLTTDRILDVLFQGPSHEQTVALLEGPRYLVNPGSVGQPRDGDPRAAYALLDTDKREIALKRIVYPVSRARDRILATSLPKALAHRLMIGR